MSEKTNLLQLSFSSNEEILVFKEILDQHNPTNIDYFFHADPPKSGELSGGLTNDLIFMVLNSAAIGIAIKSFTDIIRDYIKFRQFRMLNIKEEGEIVLKIKNENSEIEIKSNAKNLDSLSKFLKNYEKSIPNGTDNPSK